MEPQIIAQRTIAEFEFHQMLQQVSSAQLQMLVRRYQMFIQCMEREVRFEHRLHIH